MMASKVAMRPSTMRTRGDARAVIQVCVCTCSWRLGHTRASMSAANMADTSVCASPCDDVGQGRTHAPFPTCRDRGAHAPLLLCVEIGACMRPYTCHHRVTCTPLFIKIRVGPRGFPIWIVRRVVLKGRRAFYLQHWSWRSSCNGSKESGLLFVSSR